MANLGAQGRRLASALALAVAVSASLPGGGAAAAPSKGRRGPPVSAKWKTPIECKTLKFHDHEFTMRSVNLNFVNLGPAAYVKGKGKQELNCPLGTPEKGLTYVAPTLADLAVPSEASKALRAIAGKLGTKPPHPRIAGLSEGEQKQAERYAQIFGQMNGLLASLIEEAMVPSVYVPKEECDEKGGGMAPYLQTCVLDLTNTPDWGAFLKETNSPAFKLLMAKLKLRHATPKQVEALEEKAKKETARAPAGLPDAQCNEPDLRNGESDAATGSTDEQIIGEGAGQGALAKPGSGDGLAVATEYAPQGGPFCGGAANGLGKNDLSLARYLKDGHRAPDPRGYLGAKPPPGERCSVSRATLESVARARYFLPLGDGSVPRPQDTELSSGLSTQLVLDRDLSRYQSTLANTFPKPLRDCWQQAGQAGMDWQFTPEFLPVWDAASGRYVDAMVPDKSGRRRWDEGAGTQFEIPCELLGQEACLPFSARPRVADGKEPGIADYERSVQSWALFRLSLIKQGRDKNVAIGSVPEWSLTSQATTTTTRAGTRVSGHTPALYTPSSFPLPGGRRGRIFVRRPGAKVGDEHPPYVIDEANFAEACGDPAVAAAIMAELESMLGRAQGVIPGQLTGDAACLAGEWLTPDDLAGGADPGGCRVLKNELQEHWMTNALAGVPDPEDLKFPSCLLGDPVPADRNAMETRVRERFGPLLLVSSFDQLKARGDWIYLPKRYCGAPGPEFPTACVPMLGAAKGAGLADFHTALQLATKGPGPEFKLVDLTPEEVRRNRLANQNVTTGFRKAYNTWIVGIAKLSNVPAMVTTGGRLSTTAFAEQFRPKDPDQAADFNRRLGELNARVQQMEEYATLDFFEHDYTLELSKADFLRNCGQADGLSKIEAAQARAMQGLNNGDELLSSLFTYALTAGTGSYIRYATTVLKMRPAVAVATATAGGIFIGQAQNLELARNKDGSWDFTKSEYLKAAAMGLFTDAILTPIGLAGTKSRWAGTIRYEFFDAATSLGVPVALSCVFYGDQACGDLVSVMQRSAMFYAIGRSGSKAAAETDRPDSLFDVLRPPAGASRGPLDEIRRLQQDLQGLYEQRARRTTSELDTEIKNREAELAKITQRVADAIDTELERRIQATGDRELIDLFAQLRRQQAADGATPSRATAKLHDQIADLAKRRGAVPGSASGEVRPATDKERAKIQALMGGTDLKVRATRATQRLQRLLAGLKGSRWTADAKARLAKLFPPDSAARRRLESAPDDEVARLQEKVNACEL